MRAIFVGLPRTATKSLRTALRLVLDGRVFHMLELIHDGTKEPTLPTWLRAADGEPIDWRSALDGWDGIVDSPGCHFWRELRDAFPDAVMFLNVRPFDAWYESVTNTLWAVKQAAMAGELSLDGGRTPPDPALFDLADTLIWQGEFQGRFEDKEWMRAWYENRIERIKASVPDLVVWEVGVDGWQKLADALGVPVPDIPFPHEHDTDDFRATFGLPALQR